MAATTRPRAATRRATSRTSAARRSAEPRRGHQTPRLFTPPLRELTPATSLGFEVIEFWDWMRDRLEELDATRAPGDDTDYLDLLPRALDWQRWLLIHALELTLSGDAFRFRTVLLLVARQNGKSTILTVLILWRLFQDAARMVLETHMSLDHAKEAWLEAVAIAEAIPELDEEIAAANRGKGSELLQLDGGEKFKIATANRRGGRGFRGDLVIFDELREHQNWSAWSATSKTTLARRRAQVWGVSNAGDLTSVVLRQLRKIALAHITGTPIDGVADDVVEMAGDSLGLFEWSAGTIDGSEDGTPRSITDREGWAEANPSMGYTELDERAIAASLTDPEWEFRTEVLCQFVNMMGTGPFPNGAWSATRDSRDDRRERGVLRDATRPACYGIDVSHNRSKAYVAVAFWDTEGRIRVELAAEGFGTWWVAPWLTSSDRLVAPDYVTLQTRGAPVSSLREELEAAGLTVTPWEGADLAAWHGQFYDRVRLATADDALVVMTHGEQPLLDIAAESAVIKPMGDGWAIDRKTSPNDAAPLVAAIAAVGLLLSEPEPAFESAYEHGDLLVLD